MSPADCRTERDRLGLRCTVWEGRRHWLHLGHDGTVHICQQAAGEPACDAPIVSMHPRTFVSMLDWYFSDQKATRSPVGSR